MDKHASESYFVLGEGLLAESGRGRGRAPADEAPPQFRFTRMVPRSEAQLSDETLAAVAGLMAAGGGQVSEVPAGYTYLGQFIGHDLTFDKTVVMLGENVPVEAMVEGASPALDLDALYGHGPDDPESARFFDDDGLHLRIGEGGFDLPRGDGVTTAERRAAIIPDRRNDENLAVAQTHLAFIRFHNCVADRLAASFVEIRECVTKHYQWMVVTDYLPRVCAQDVIDDVFENGRKAFEVGAAPDETPTMPIEFSVAAFRFGHSMIRRNYSWNAVFEDGAGTLDQLLRFSGMGGDLGGGERLPHDAVADFRRLYDFSEAGRPDLAAPAGRLNFAMRCDTALAGPTADLPEQALAEPAGPPHDPIANLALRDMKRAKMVKLATGQELARFLAKDCGVPVSPLTEDQIRDGAGGVRLDPLSESDRAGLVAHTPLWFYVLREAELNGGVLDGVGARIVAETFHRAIEGSRASILRDRGWRPSLGPDEDTFRMVDLLLLAYDGEQRLLAPLG